MIYKVSYVVIGKPHPGEIVNMDTPPRVGDEVVLGDETLKTIAQELVEAVKRSVSIDWTVRENARAHIRVIVKRILRKYGYPPDKQEKATLTVLEQAEVICGEWAAA